MSFRLLIDECLSPTLVAMAHAAGHPEGTCVREALEVTLGPDGSASVDLYEIPTAA